MHTNDTRKKLEDIIGGIVIDGQTDNCTAARNHLCASFKTSKSVKKDFDSESKIKEEQRTLLRNFISNNNLWLSNQPDESRYISEGGEAKIYLDHDNRSVIKLNDAVYYNT